MKYKVFYGGSKCKVWNGNNPYVLNMDEVSSLHGTTEDDAYANDYINGLAFMDIYFHDDDIVVEFAHCEDQELLTRVEQGKTKVRLQLLVHKVSACARTRGSTRWHCLRLGFGTYDNPHTPGERWARTLGRDKNDIGEGSKGPTHIDLTAQQLMHGYATFNNARGHGHGVINLYEYDENYKYMSVEMFCPALYRRGKDIYYYEREEGAYYVADNCVSAVYD